MAFSSQTQNPIFFAREKSNALPRPIILKCDDYFICCTYMVVRKDFSAFSGEKSFDSTSNAVRPKILELSL